jgi:uncharacterized membrane protein
MATVVTARSRQRSVRVIAAVVALLVLIMLGSVLKRLLIDVPNLAAGTLPPDPYDVRFVQHPWIAWIHIGPGILYLLGAPLQLSYRFRSRHYTFHRWLGRLLAGSAILAGIFALVFGILFPFGGIFESSATVVFGAWFLTCLALAIRAIRRDDMFHHRRWMIRAFAVGLGVGTIRIWLGVFQGFGLLEFQHSFGPAFWISFSAHAAGAELWLRRFPNPPEDSQLTPEPTHQTAS